MVESLPEGWTTLPLPEILRYFRLGQLLQLAPTGRTSWSSVISTSSA